VLEDDAIVAQRTSQRDDALCGVAEGMTAAGPRKEMSSRHTTAEFAPLVPKSTRILIRADVAVAGAFTAAVENCTKVAEFGTVGVSTVKSSWPPDAIHVTWG